MTTTPKELPRGFWKAEVPNLRKIAANMTAQQIAEHYNTTPKRAINIMSLHNIEYLGKRKPTFNAAQDKELRKLAPTHTAQQLAKHFDVPVAIIRRYAHNNVIKLMKERCHLWNSRREELQRIAPNMTLEQLQAHYQAQNSRHTKDSIRQALVMLGIGYKPGRSGPAPQPKTERAPKAKPAVKNAPCTSLTTPAALTAAIPPRTSIASKAPAQIIWPAHVQVQRIALATPPNNAPICASTMRAPYRTGQGLTGYRSY